jgi:hypothetical protein
MQLTTKPLTGRMGYDGGTLTTLTRRSARRRGRRWLARRSLALASGRARRWWQAPERVHAVSARIATGHQGGPRGQRQRRDGRAQRPPRAAFHERSEMWQASRACPGPEELPRCAVEPDDENLRHGWRKSAPPTDRPEANGGGRDGSRPRVCSHASLLRPPSIVFVLLDTTRADRIGADRQDAGRRCSTTSRRGSSSSAITPTRTRPGPRCRSS